MDSRTTAPTPTTTMDPRFVGWYSDAAGWTALSCAKETEYYAESGSHFGCPWIFTGCRAGPFPTISPDPKIYYGCTANQGTCITYLVHSTYPAQIPDPNQKSGLYCAPMVLGSEYDVYRIKPTAPPPSSTSLSASSVASESTSSMASAPHKSASVSSGVIAGATVAGVVLLAILAATAWYFGLHRRRTTTKDAGPDEHQHTQLVPSWQQPEQEQIFEVGTRPHILEADSRHVFEAPRHHDVPSTRDV